jgi:hypothetical protein
MVHAARCAARAARRETRRNQIHHKDTKHAKKSLRAIGARFIPFVLFVLFVPLWFICSALAAWRLGVSSFLCFPTSPRAHSSGKHQARLAGPVAPRVSGKQSESV